MDTIILIGLGIFSVVFLFFAYRHMKEFIRLDKEFKTLINEDKIKAIYLIYGYKNWVKIWERKNNTRKITNYIKGWF